MRRLLEEYKNSLALAKKSRVNCAEEDQKIFSDIVRDLEYVITWIESGRMPGAKRPIERRSVYQNTVFFEPAIIANLYSDPNSMNLFLEIEEGIDKVNAWKS